MTVSELIKTLAELEYQEFDTTEFEKGGKK